MSDIRIIVVYSCLVNSFFFYIKCLVNMTFKTELMPMVGNLTEQKEL